MSMLSTVAKDRTHKAMGSNCRSGDGPNRGSTFVSADLADFLQLAVVAVVIWQQGGRYDAGTFVVAVGVAVPRSNVGNIRGDFVFPVPMLFDDDSDVEASEGCAENSAVIVIR